MDKTEDASSSPPKIKENPHLVLKDKLLREPEVLIKNKEVRNKPKPKTGYREDGPQSSLDLTTMYLNEIGHTPLLSANEEVRLAREIAQGNDNSRKQMIESNLRLVVTLAKRSLNRGLSFLDLIEEGNLGLMRAVEKFDPELGFRFSTYAAWWIKQSIDRAIMNNGQTISMSIHIIKDINACTRALRQLSEELGRKPSDEVGKEIGLT